MAFRLLLVAPLALVTSLQLHTALPRRAAIVAAGAAAGAAQLVRPTSAATDGITQTVLTAPTDPSSPTPLRAQKVSVDYTLWVGGFEQKQIDTSKGSAIPPKLPQPFTFMVGVGQVIPGWDRVVKEMRVGETRRVVVPASLGYGEKGAGPIPGGAPLYFEMKLLELKPPQQLSEKQLKWLEEHPEP